MLLYQKLRDFIYERFRLNVHNSTIRNEVLAGITNYFTVIYIVILVPEILVSLFPEAQADEMLVALTASSFIAAGLGTILMGILINVPFVQGPSLAIGTFITYTVCKNLGYTYNQALAIVFISGICFFILSIFGIEKKIHRAIPLNIKYAVSAGIGLFIALTGLQKAHIIVYSSGQQVNLFNIADITSNYTKEAILALTGVVLITIMLKKHVHGAIFIGKIICIIAAFPLGLIKAIDVKKFIYEIPVSKTFFQMDFNGLIDSSGENTVFKSVLILVMIVFSVCIMDIFETMSMLIATDNFIKISQEGQVKKRIPQILEIDAATTSIGSVIGATTVSTYIESTAGIVEGGRTGLTSVVTGTLFLLSVFIAPLVYIIPSAATATTLIIAGILMMNVIKYIDFQDEAEAVPAFLTMFIMPLANSLLAGIAFGIISYIAIAIFIGKAKKINYVLYIISAFLLLTLIYLPK